MTLEEYGIKKAAEIILEKGHTEGNGVDVTDDEAIKIIISALRILSDRIKKIERSLSEIECDRHNS